MRKAIAGVIAAIAVVCLGSIAFAADGDLVVNGNGTFNGNGFFNNVGVGTTTPTMKLDVNGSLNVRGSSGGTYWPWGTAAGIHYAGANSQYGLQLIPATAGTYEILFTKSDGTLIGYINDDAYNVYYATASDRRLKENIVTTTMGLATLLRIPVTDFNFVADPQKIRRQGFVAQDLYAIYPQAVSKADDGVSPLS